MTVEECLLLLWPWKASHNFCSMFGATDIPPMKEASTRSWSENLGSLGRVAPFRFVRGSNDELDDAAVHQKDLAFSAYVRHT